MTTYTQFAPSPTQAFSFRPTLDGTVYNVTVPWSFFGQRYYVTCYTLGGNLVFSVPLIGSPASVDIEAASWAPNTVTITTSLPHTFKVGSTVNLTIINTTPVAYNGTYPCTIINGNQFTYALSSDPGEVSVFGSTQYNIDLAPGYFASTLIYREQNRVFEVSP
jgi:hypothetical protein